MPGLPCSTKNLREITDGKAVDNHRQRTTFGPDQIDRNDCNSENLSDLGSDRCPFEQKDPSESEEVKEVNPV